MITLTWKVDITEQTGCPDYVPDPYTGQYPTTHCLVYHYRTVTKEMGATFETEEQAEAFKKNAPSGCYDWRKTP